VTSWSHASSHNSCSDCCPRPQAHLSRLNGQKVGEAVPLDQLHSLDPLPSQSLQPNDAVAALYDKNLDRKLSKGTASPKWTEVYYPARISPDQTNVPAGSTRVIYDDDGKTAVVPAEAHFAGIGRSLPALIRVRQSATALRCSGGLHGQLPRSAHLRSAPPTTDA